jgi:hypothetical protein
LDFLLLEELRLLAPDLVIFLTGPWHGYDGRIAWLLQAKALPFSSFPERQLCEFKSSVLDYRIFGTYHPNYLQRSRRADEVIKAVSLAMRIYCNRGMVVDGVPLEIRQVQLRTGIPITRYLRRLGEKIGLGERPRPKPHYEGTNVFPRPASMEMKSIPNARMR